MHAYQIAIYRVKYGHTFFCIYDSFHTSSVLSSHVIIDQTITRQKYYSMTKTLILRVTKPILTQIEVEVCMSLSKNVHFVNGFGYIRTMIH